MFILLKINDKILKPARKKATLTTADFSSETMQARRYRMTFLQ